MKIYLPHIHYTVYVRTFKKAPDSVSSALAYTENIDNNSCAIYLGKKCHVGDVAHELIHVLQFICLARNMDFRLEQEHMGYLMQYLMGRLLGTTWK